jgi:hypothetical protein
MKGILNYKRIKEFLKNGWKYSLRYTVLGKIVRTICGDVIFEKLVNFPSIGYWPKIRNPRSFNEKVMYRKLFTNKKLYSKISNKFTVREYVKDRLGGDILNDVFYIGDNPSKIPFKKLPSKYVVKTGNKGVIFVDGDGPNNDEIVNTCKNKLSNPYGLDKGEYWYGEIDPKVIVEKKIVGKYQEIPIDFKVFVFHGEVKYIQVDFNRFSGLKRRIYDKDWNATDVKLGYPLGPKIDRPKEIDRMMHISERLGNGIDFVRVDLYIDKDDGVTFGEMTLAPGSGGTGFTPVSFDFEIGRHW